MKTYNDTYNCDGCDEKNIGAETHYHWLDRLYPGLDTCINCSRLLVAYHNNNAPLSKEFKLKLLKHRILERTE